MLVDKSQFFDGLFAISHEFTTDINSNCISVNNGALIFVQNAHGCARQFFAEGSHRQDYLRRISFAAARENRLC